MKRYIDNFLSCPFLVVCQDIRLSIICLLISLVILYFTCLLLRITLVLRQNLSIRNRDTGKKKAGGCFASSRAYCIARYTANSGLVKPFSI